MFFLKMSEDDSVPCGRSFLTHLNIALCRWSSISEPSFCKRSCGQLEITPMIQNGVGGKLRVRAAWPAICWPCEWSRGSAEHAEEFVPLVGAGANACGCAPS